MFGPDIWNYKEPNLKWNSKLYFTFFPIVRDHATNKDRLYKLGMTGEKWEFPSMQLTYDTFQLTEVVT